MPYVAGGDWAAEYEEREDCGCGRGQNACCGTVGCRACHPPEDIEAEAPRARRGRSGGMEMYDPRGYGGFGLLSYSYKPPPLWKGGAGGEPGRPYYGMEIEISCGRNETMAWAAENFGTDLVYLKSDGSVRGFEMVTHPMTFEWALDNFPWQLLPELKSMGCSIDPGSNGIHVHVSRSGFGDKHGLADAHMLRWMKLLYRNQNDVIRIARRNSTWGTFTATHQRGQMAHLKARKGLLDAANVHIRNQIRAIEAQRAEDTRRAEREYRRVQRELNNRYDAAYRIEDMPQREAEIAVIAGEDQRNMDEYRRIRASLDRTSNDQVTRIRRGMLEDTTTARYSAINTGPRQTFEVRAFASTLDPVTAQSTIGLVAASVEYTRQITAHDIIHDGALTWAKFAAWLDTQPLYAAVKYANENAGYPSPARSVI